jgi:hypothetical protein
MGTRAGWMVLGAIVGAIGPARARADGLAGLDAKLRETGRILSLIHNNEPTRLRCNSYYVIIF